MQSRVAVTPKVAVRVMHADGTVTDLGDMSNRPTWRQRLVLRKLRRRQERTR